MEYRFPSLSLPIYCYDWVSGVSGVSFWGGSGEGKTPIQAFGVKGSLFEC
jgi:hypothetical protein